MNIVCDIGHPAHVNFFKSALTKLSNEGHVVTIIGLNRGKLRDIIRKELPGFRIHFAGKHRGGKLSIIFEANLKKFMELLLLLHDVKPDIGISVGSFTLGTALKIYGAPNIQFDDDPERKLNVFLEKLTSTELYFPPIISANGKIGVMNALKEWAYLSPQYFSPNKFVLREYGLSPCEYFFVREISTKSLNYGKQYPYTIALFAHELPRDFKVLLSLEDKASRNRYPPDWILLEEPVRDIHSLMYYSKIVVSSGDSIAREGALLGVPSIYCGRRKMSANAMMIRKGMLFVEGAQDVVQCANEIVSGTIAISKQDDFRRMLMDEWDDATEFVVKRIMAYEK